MEIYRLYICTYLMLYDIQTVYCICIYLILYDIQTVYLYISDAL
jgi:hypothetical protein